MSQININNEPSAEVIIYENGTPVTVVVDGFIVNWGDIHGTLSNQTDLQNALNAKVPYTGATGNVTLGEYGLTSGYVQFDTTPTTYTPAVGNMGWNDSEGTIDLLLKGGIVSLPLGQKQVARIVNGTGGNVLKSNYQVVKVTGAQGQRLQVNLAQANNDANSADTLGLIAENINNNNSGFIITSGLVENINTTGSLQSETWTDGNILYLSPTTPGAITNVKPQAPNHTVIVGFVVYAHANNGKIFVKVDNGYELDELHNVLINTGTLANGQVLKYNSSLQVWENNSDAGITGSGTSGQVAYWNGTTTQTGSNNLFWDAANNRLGIGTNAPSFALQVESDAQVNGLRIGRGSGNISTNTVVGSSAGAANTTGTNNSFFGISAGQNNTTGGFNSFFGRFAGLNNTTGTNNIGFGREAGRFIASNAPLTVANNSTFLGVDTRANADSEVNQLVIGYTAIGLGSNTTVIGNSSTTFGRWWGNLLIGSSVNGGQALQVTGDTLLKGSGNTSGTTALTVQNSDGTNLINVRNDNTIIFNGTPIFTFTASAGDWLWDASTNRNFTIQGGRATSNTNTAPFRLNNSFAMTSGSANQHQLWISTTINQTGGANGITRGLYVNPTLTAAADWRSIEWSNNTGWGLYGAGTANNYLAGDLAIGGTTIDANYAIQVNSSKGIRISGTGGGFGYTIVRGSETTTIANNASATVIASTNVLQFNTAATERLRIFSNGNVGIGVAGTDAGFKLDVNGTARIQNDLTISDTRNIILATTTGTKIGTATSQKLGFWNATPIVQPTTGVASATRVGGGGTTLTDTDTFDGYTLAQIVKALRNTGILA